MKAIIIDSTSNILFVAVIKNEGYKYLTSNGEAKKHNVLLLPYIEKLLMESEMTIDEIDCIGCVIGAGSFTGIRLGVTTANGLASAKKINLIGMNAFEIIAYNEDSRVLVAIDARHGNYYGGIFEHGSQIELGNYTEEDLTSFKGNIIFKPNEPLIKNTIDVFKQKYSDCNFVTFLEPLYLKKSQAERELE